jgi:hypothetical protein
MEAKLDELIEARNDMENLFNSTHIATLFLDIDLKIRRYTTSAIGLFNLLPSDAGRPITDLATVLDYPDLEPNANEVLRSLIARDQEVSASDGRWFKCAIRPYRTLDNRIDGVMITFIDITKIKALEETLREALAVLRQRSADQTEELDAATVLRGVMEQAQTVLEQRLADQAGALRQYDEDQAQGGA